MAHFPTEIVADIISRLPVEPIVRFRCVSKPWCALIDSPDFIKLHLKRSIETRSNRLLILRAPSSIYSGSLYSLDNTTAVELEHPFKNCYEYGPQVLGSCDGLVLLYSQEEGQLAVWNPSTRKYQIFSSTFDDTQTWHNIATFYGIGYDSVHDDYKVVQIAQTHRKGVVHVFGSQVKVYSLKSNTWGRTMDFPCYLSLDGTYGMLAGGALHWVAFNKPLLFSFAKDPFIAAFDLATEECRLVPIPNFDTKEHVFHVKLAVLEGCLCILCKARDSLFDLWLMKDYGVEESWTKLISAPQTRDFQANPNVTLLACSMDGAKVLLLENYTELIWFDLNRKVVDTVNISGLPKIFQAQVCMQSLVAIGRGREDEVKKQHIEESKENKPTGTGKERDGSLSEGSS